MPSTKRQQVLRRFMTAALLFCSALSLAAEQPVLVEATGEALMGEHDTPKEVMGRAKRDAQIKAMEKAVGTFIKAHTLVSNNQVADDLVYASVRGKVQKTEILQEGWDAKDRNLYRVSLKALVEPIYPEKGEGMSARLSLSRDQLREGEDVRILYQSGADGYVYLFSIAADGSVTLIFPNTLHKDNSVLKGKAYDFPPSGSPIRLSAAFLPGFKGGVAEERVKLIATRKKEDLIPLGFQEGMFTTYDASSTGMINDLVRRLNQLDPADWAEATAVYRIVR
jgi:hypothetical protein